MEGEFHQNNPSSGESRTGTSLHLNQGLVVNQEHSDACFGLRSVWVVHLAVQSPRISVAVAGALQLMGLNVSESCCIKTKFSEQIFCSGNFMISPTAEQVRLQRGRTDTKTAFIFSSNIFFK